MTTPFDRDRDVERLLEAALPGSMAAGSADCLSPELLAAWADGTLDTADARMVDAHLGTCADCLALVGILARTGDGAEMPAVAAPTAAAQDGHVLPFPARRALRVLGPLAAAAALIVWFAWPGRPVPTASDSAKQMASATDVAASPTSPAFVEPAPAAPVTSPMPAPHAVPPRPKVSGQPSETSADARRGRTTAEPAASTPPAPGRFPERVDLGARTAPTPVATAAPQQATAPRVGGSGGTAGGVPGGVVGGVIGGIAPPPPPPPAPASAPPPPAPAMPMAVPPPQAAPAPTSASRVLDPSATAVRSASGERSFAVGDQLSAVTDAARAPLPVFEIVSDLGRSSGNTTSGAGRGGGRGGAAATMPAPPRTWRVVQGTRIESSTDNGLTWTSIAATPASVIRAGVSPGVNVCWLVGDRGLVMLSTDGVTFVPIAFPDTVDIASVRATSATSAVVTTVDARIFSTADSGRTWQRLQVFPAPSF